MILEENSELKNELALLKREVAEMKSIFQQFSATKSINEHTLTLESAKLEQNIPNPFQQKTTIPYFIPQDSKNAQLHVFSLEGQLLETIKINSFGEGEIQLQIDGFASGQYYYSLEVNGRRVDTKKMSIIK